MLTSLERTRFEIWKSIQMAPSWIIYRWQQKKWKALITYASRDIEFYRLLWKNTNLSISEVSDIRKLEGVPIVDRKIFKTQPVNTYINNKLLGVATLEWRQTSGSTGEPFRFLRATLPPSMPYHDFLAYRCLYWNGLPLKYITEKMKVVRIRMTRFSHPNRLFIPVSDFLTKPGTIIEALRKFNGEVIESYPSILIELSNYLSQKRGRGFSLGFRFALSYGEMLTSEQRNFIEDILQCKVYNRYGLEEFGAIGTECAERNGFHLHNESFVLNIVDENGKNQPAGKGGRIILTDLQNYNMPFIRYDTGDYGRLLTDACPCGLATTRFTIEGRVGSFIISPMRKIHHFEIAEIFNDFSDFIQQYQIVQAAPESIEIRIVTTILQNNSRLKELRSKFEKLLGEKVRFHFKIIPTITRLQNGKVETIKTAILSEIH